jgi:FecR protein
MKVSHLIALFVGFLSLSMTALAATGQAPNTYRTSTVIGSVVWKNSLSGESQPLRADQALPEGAIISTGEASSVSLVFASGATALIGEKSEVAISKFQQALFGDDASQISVEEPSVSTTEILLNKGTITSGVSKLRPESSYVVKTPIGAAGVRGTVFQVIYDPIQKVLRVLTAEGKVVFTTATDNVEIPVIGGKYITLYFDLNDKGQLHVIKSESGFLKRAQIKALLKLVGRYVSEIQLLIAPDPSSRILSDDTP